MHIRTILTRFGQANVLDAETYTCPFGPYGHLQSRKHGPSNLLRCYILHIEGRV
jgi:hypothetical protein